MDRPIDVLTGLIEESEFNAEMERLIAEGKEFALIALDIDSLMALNSEYGHDAGDDVFRLIARNIKELFPAPCTGFRGTRDHFNILMPGSGKEEAFLKAEQLRRLVCETKLNHTKDGKPMRQSISAGVSSYPDDGSRPADIFRRADSAMLRAKKSGRNLVCLAREEKLLPKTSHYTQAQLEKLTDVSEKLSVGESALLREALDDLLKKYDIDM